ncbi:WhiB family redox-sensing transcriptional regulator [Hoyosella altamirensis]|uniref:Transcriptional regulator WhiB n=1 Tax=Hoyosella altamirensis TaxID=616997 RepID=A0A839RH00_9ACTN|nr:WhiB family redox-sensing transcriptional regulator [Hoyosella altamirensis]
MTIDIGHRTGVGLSASVVRVLPDRLRALPCRREDPDLWFADSPADLEYAKTLCAECPVRARCLELALDRQEPWGVWGGEIFDRGAIVARKRPRGRPPKASPAA